MHNPGVAIICLRLCLFWILAGLGVSEARRRGVAGAERPGGKYTGALAGTGDNWLGFSRKGQHHSRRLPCPTRRCRCRRRQGAMHLKCSPNPEVLENVPYFRPFNITLDSVALSGHNFTHIQNDAFINIRVLHLDLSGNILEEGISDHAFRGQEAHLQVLDLSNSRLSEIPTKSLKQLVSLTILRLNDNYITRVPRNAFKQNKKLVDLALYRNMISVIEPGSFAGLGNLQNLKLFHNDIQSISRRAFRRMRSLTSLDLSSNQIEVVHSGSLRPLTQLTWLDLSYNLISQLTSRTFKGIHRLKYLNLEHNALLNITDGAFLPVRKRLKYLSLDINMTQVTNMTFNGLRKLQHLYLGELNRSSLPTGVFSSMGQLKFLSLSDFSHQFDGLTTSMFAPHMELKQLSIWTVPVHTCSCLQQWIVQMVKKGAFLHGYCLDGRPISCRRRPKGVKRRSRPNFKSRRRKEQRHQRHRQVRKNDNVTERQHSSESRKNR